MQRHMDTHGDCYMERSRHAWRKTEVCIEKDPGMQRERPRHIERKTKACIEKDRDMHRERPTHTERKTKT